MVSVHSSLLCLDLAMLTTIVEKQLPVFSCPPERLCAERGVRHWSSDSKQCAALFQAFFLLAAFLAIFVLVLSHLFSPHLPH